MGAVVTCGYCGHEGTTPGEMKFSGAKTGFVCANAKACDAREAEQHRAHIADLRRQQRAGDELTEAEKHELEDAR